LKVLLGVLLLLGACRSDSKGGRVIVLGLDGMDPQVIDQLLSEGALPNFARLRREGAYGRLASSEPLLSPVIWTTIATGKPPLQHGIGHFVAVNEKTGEQLPVTSSMRKVKAVWNILSDAGRRADVVGWWATWPAEAINGAVVSDHTCYHFLFEDGFSGPGDATGVVAPAQLLDEIKGMIRRPADIGFEQAAPFVRVEREEFDRPFAFEDELGHFRWALAAAQTYKDIGLHLWKTRRPDALLVYIEAPDSTSHLFGHLFRNSGLAGELAAQQQRYGGTVEAMYRYADSVVGEFIQVMDDDTTLVVLSDHGFELGVLPEDPSKLRDMRRVSEAFHRTHGILYLYGNQVRADVRLDGPTILDVAPTLLALVGMAPAADMPGKVLRPALLSQPSAAVATYEKGAVQAARGSQPSGVDSAVMEHLRALGYLDAESPQGERNLAAVYFKEGRYEESAGAYERLIKENPEDGALHASLGGVYGALKRYDEALAQLTEAEKLAPLNPEIYYNRGLIHERRGAKEQAVADYKTALRYDPRYVPARSGLERLTGSSEVYRPNSANERAALQLAQHASDFARKGDYRAAMQNLDEAERLAPKLALIHQYRSNVAFLRGDRDGAIAALKKALEIEPENELFKRNLEQLEKRP
jgi:tetratricopeptide (TPR) repeat protein/predicted AlkP superfamily pyrophosphatase or phosphodiesterase